MTNNEKDLSDKSVSRWLSIVWRNMNDWIDFYETPLWCVESLLDRENFSWNILEPACGGWAISNLVSNRGYTIISQDIRTDDWVYWMKWIDFMRHTIVYDNIITNPPYCIAKDFILKSIECSRYKVCMFLKLQFLESIDRYDFFKSTPLKKIYVFCKRPTLYPADWPKPKNKWTIAYARYIREHWYEWEPTIDWIK